ncbi:DUF4340 domain-containing protein [Paenibacillus sp. P96]|uniref:DUF4340 domain-containing protein n=1 Tax=Paenibacillus zeirhizosphaerae TaxID=2987519 RepID=A0ABT9FUZ4_9BACL|nr:DUF4340 domain-containing protein [Paenibacillus sp. P96]MDP4098499.1 DUF4340 domain-containing protein [Paenibacillus sp. P96]
MRKWMPTLVLVIIFAAGVVYASSHNFFRESDPVPQKLLAVQRDTLSEIRIEQTGGEAVELLKQNGEWAMKLPQAYPLNSYAVDHWFNALEAATAEEVIEEQPQDIGKYGIDGENGWSITITENDGTTHKLAVGIQLPSGASSYAQLDSGPVISVSQDSLSGMLLSVSALTDTTPFEWDKDHLSVMEWEGTAFSWVLQRGKSGTDWTLNGKKINEEDALSLSDKLINTATAEQLRSALELKNESNRFTLTVTLNEVTDPQVYQGWVTPDQSDTVWIIPPESNWAYMVPVAEVEEIEQAAESVKPVESESGK